MLRSLTFSLIIFCILVGSVDARSRNPRTTDFDQIERLVQADFEEFKQYMQGLGDDLRRDGQNCFPASRLSVDHDAGIIKWYVCVWTAEQGGQAYLNELELSKAYADGGMVKIPCKANRECVWGKQPEKDHFWFALHGKNKKYLANQIVELLKPN